MKNAPEERLKDYIADALKVLGVPDVPFVIERPADMGHGDWATNAALAAFKSAVFGLKSQIPKDEKEAIHALKFCKNPRDLAMKIVEEIIKKCDRNIATIEVAGPGFINIKLSKTYFIRELEEALASEKYGNNETLKGKKVVVEYTDPNPFKAFHIGHLMSNTVGESVSRLIEASGADTKRACYQGDVGMHVATVVAYAIEKQDQTTLATGESYSLGSKKLTEDPSFKERVIEVNKKIYGQTEGQEMAFYRAGRELSLQNFEAIYKRLGTTHGDGKAFNFYFFESNSGAYGKEVVEKNIPEIFEKSDGAVVYKGDEVKGLHTRVFINKEGLPTYEAKELGLAKIKYDTYPYDISIVITGNEVNDYFKVLLDAMAKVFPELAAKTEHYGHGMLRLPSGKMSSRTGDVVTAESLIDETKTKALEKIKESAFSDSERDEVAEAVAIGAIKYSILRQAAGKDIIFDVEQSLSFEGDSGPYLQYAHARTRSLLAKARLEGKKIHVGAIEGEEIRPLHKHLLRFPEVVLRAEKEREPHYVATYLVELAREFSAFYGNTIVLDGSPDEGYKLALVELTSRVLSHGLDLLGIKAPERM